MFSMKSITEGQTGRFPCQFNCSGCSTSGVSALSEVVSMAEGSVIGEISMRQSE